MLSNHVQGTYFLVVPHCELVAVAGGNLQGVEALSPHSCTQAGPLQVGLTGCLAGLRCGHAQAMSWSLGSRVLNPLLNPNARVTSQGAGSCCCKATRMCPDVRMLCCNASCERPEEWRKHLETALSVVYGLHCYGNRRCRADYDSRHMLLKYRAGEQKAGCNTHHPCPKQISGRQNNAPNARRVMTGTASEQLCLRSSGLVQGPASTCHAAYTCQYSCALHPLVCRRSKEASRCCRCSAATGTSMCRVGGG